MDAYRPLSGISLPSPSPRTPYFPESSHGYYSAVPRRPRNKLPTSLKWWAVGGTVSVMVALAFAIELALYFSNKNHGFPTGGFSTDRVQWLSGFLPVLAISPLVWIWRRSDSDIKRLQPYVALSKGPAKAEESVLLDLEHDGLFKMLGTAFKNGHILILGTSIICLMNVLLQPLAGSFFVVKPGMIIRPSENTIRSTAALGLNPSYTDLTSFVAAAGYAEAAAQYNLSDPPFVRGGWAVAPFELSPGLPQGSTISVHTTGVYTNVSCVVPESVSLELPASSTSLNWTLRASFPAYGPGCITMQPIDGSTADIQYGVDPMPNCSNPNRNGIAGRDVAENPFASIVFWFATIPRTGTGPKNGLTSRRDPGVPTGCAVFCTPTITAYSVKANMDVATRLLISLNVTGEVSRNVNNVTGGELAGKAFNGLFYDNPDFNLTNPSVRARTGSMVQSGLSSTIFSLASNHGRDTDTAFSDASGFLNLTEKVYTQYLSLAALSNYFMPADAFTDADIMTWPVRLWIHPVSAHVFASLLVLVALVGTVVHALHSRQRKRLYLASLPGSMAHAMCLLPHLSTVSKDGEGGMASVGPLDDKKILQRKLNGVRFMLGGSSGKVVPARAGESWVARDSDRVHGQGSKPQEYELEDPRKSLLSPD